MDVARFKYPPHWVPLETVFESMKSIDPDTGNFFAFNVLILIRKEPRFHSFETGRNDFCLLPIASSSIYMESIACQSREIRPHVERKETCHITRIRSTVCRIAT